MTDIMARATDLAERNTPGVAFRGLGVLLENLFLGVFTTMGWLLGRLWFHGSQLIFLVGLAFVDGYKQGARVQAAPPRQAIAPPVMPVIPTPPLMDDGRTIDPYVTPFGVPFGPNVQAWSEKG